MKLPLLNVTAGEARKAITTLIVLGIFVVGYFIAPLPDGFEPAAIVVGTALVGFLAVFGVKNATTDDWSKAIMALISAAAGVAALFAKIPHLTELEQAIGAALPFVLGLIVHQVPNAIVTHRRR